MKRCHECFEAKDLSQFRIKSRGGKRWTSSKCVQCERDLKVIKHKSLLCNRPTENVIEFYFDRNKNKKDDYSMYLFMEIV